MTRQSKKIEERAFAEAAIKSLGQRWTLGADSEHPDFVVTDDNATFGLEVTSVFVGPQGRAGAAMKERESQAQRRIRELRLAYEAEEDIPLKVQLVGDISASNLAMIVPALLAEDLSSKPLTYHFVIDEKRGLRAHVTKALSPDWFSVNDRVGFVHRDPTAIIDAAIETKSRELDRYRQAAGSDVRLLLVANRIMNSGKLTLEGSPTFDLHGFRAVYLYPYPEQVIVLRPGSAK